MTDRMHDRHNIPAPATGTNTRATGVTTLRSAAFLDGLKERIHELFLTLPGLPGHVTQVQQEFNRLSNSNLDDDETLQVCHRAYEQLGKAAEHATFDFAAQQFDVRSIHWTMSVERANGKVITWKTN